MHDVLDVTWARCPGGRPHKKTAEVPAGLGGSSGDEGMPLIGISIGGRPHAVFDVAQIRCKSSWWGAAPPNRQPDCSFAHGKVSGAASGCLTASAAAARSI